MQKIKKYPGNIIKLSYFILNQKVKEMAKTIQKTPISQTYKSFKFRVVSKPY